MNRYDDTHSPEPKASPNHAARNNTWHRTVPSHASRNRLSRLARATVLLIGIVGILGAVFSPVPGAARVVRAGGGGNPVQPGEKYLTIASQANSYCAIGPTVGEIVFTAGHCNQTSVPPALGGYRVTDSATGYDPEPTRMETDWRYSTVAGPVSSSIATWIDCPAIRTRGEEPEPGPCRTRGRDIEVAGVLQPWPGLPLAKSGPTTGTTTARSTSVLSHKRIDGNTLLATAGAKTLACSGDSGSPTFAKIGDDYYITGMLVGGDGSVTPDAPGGRHDKTCYKYSEDRTNYIGFVTIEQLCAQLPDDVAAGKRCLAEAGRVIGKLEPVVVDGDRISIRGWAFDPDRVGLPLTRIGVLVDGNSVPFERVRRLDVSTVLRLPPAEYGFTATVSGVTPGEHQVCVLFANEQGTFGADQGSCQAITVSQ